MVFEIHLTRFEAFENRLNSSLPPTERWTLSCYFVLYVLWLLLYCIMMTIVLYHDDYCTYRDKYCIVSRWLLHVSWWLYHDDYTALANGPKWRVTCKNFAAYGKTISYVIFKEMEGAFQCGGFSVLAATVLEERLFCLIRDVGCIQHNTRVYIYMILTPMVYYCLYSCMCLCVSVYSVQESTAMLACWVRHFHRGSPQLSLFTAVENHHLDDAI